jgi:single-strand DNA-binding protein
MANLNRWQGIGRLGKDPEVRNLDNGNTVANFSIACSESYKDRTTGEKKETTEWINCVAWKGLADIAGRFLHKGDLVMVEGKLRTRSWEKDGQTRYITEVVLDNLIMLSGNKKEPATASPRSEAVNPSGNSTDDLPF